MKTRRLSILLSTAPLLLILTINLRPQAMPPPIVGRWDLTVSSNGEKYTSWLEVERSGFQALVGRFVGRIGKARPIGGIDWNDGVARFNIPAQWESRSTDLHFEGRLQEDGLLVGTITMSNGTGTQYVEQFVGKRAPSLQRQMPKVWGPPVKLFNGKDLSGWIPAPTASSLPNHWAVRNGLLVNTADEGANLMSVQRFEDFKLHAEFRFLSKRGTSGIFPRGRYWVVLHSLGDNPAERFGNITGSVNGFLFPNEDPTLGADIWQKIDITLVGRRITVVINNKAVIVDQIIPGITGSAIDSDEAAPGPIMLQGEELRCRVEFRNLTISMPR